jgi:hypothetical protein
LSPQPWPHNRPTRIYIEERVTTVSGVSVHCDTFGNCYGHNTSTTRNVSLQVTGELMKTLYQQNGDVAYISPAKFKVSNPTKDVCAYVEAHRH